MPASLPFQMESEHSHNEFGNTARTYAQLYARTNSARKSHRTAPQHNTAPLHILHRSSMFGLQHIVVVNGQHGPMILAVPASFGHGHVTMEGSLLMGIDTASSFSERHISSGFYTDIGIRTLYHATNSSGQPTVSSPTAFVAGRVAAWAPASILPTRRPLLGTSLATAPMLCCRPMSTWDTLTPSGTA